MRDQELGSFVFRCIISSTTTTNTSSLRLSLLSIPFPASSRLAELASLQAMAQKVPDWRAVLQLWRLDLISGLLRCSECFVSHRFPDYSSGTSLNRR
jgi:hypothetical protein